MFARLTKASAPILLGALAVALVFFVPLSAGTTWTSVAEIFGGLSALTVVGLGAVWIGGLTCNSVALAASMPGLTVRRALTLSLTGSAVANVLPMGGAGGVGLNYVMTRRWGFSRTKFATYTATTNVLDVASKLLVAAAASLILLLEGRIHLFHRGVAPVLEFFLVVPCLAVLLFSRPTGTAVGRALDSVVRVGSRLIRRPISSRLAERIPQIAHLTRTAIRRRWAHMTFGSLSYAGLQIILLWGCLRAAGLHLDLTTLICAFAADRVLTMVPLTPGGVGIVEGGMAAVLSALGFDAGPAVAGVLIYRGFTYLAEIPVGGALAVLWTVFHRRQDPQLAPAQGTGR
ncbi:MAG: lysylphosphatidylglycerol synthase transmembrane domain-containing protein [Propionibacteriaceae bacterium]